MNRLPQRAATARYRVLSAREIVGSRPKVTAWGAWRLVGRTLVYRPQRRAEYWIDLTRCQTAAQLLDWLAHLAEKTWISSSDLGDLVRAFDHVVGLRSAR